MRSILSWLITLNDCYHTLISLRKEREMKESKDPPRGGSAPTKRILRKEANFGCAICGEPYLTYHHFDPSWAERHHDEPEGMIALCVKHAGMADAKAFTKKQLRAFKR